MLEEQEEKFENVQAGSQARETEDMFLEENPGQAIMDGGETDSDEGQAGKSEDMFLEENPGQAIMDGGETDSDEDTKERTERNFVAEKHLANHQRTLNNNSTVVPDDLLCVDIKNQFPIILIDKIKESPEAAIRRVQRKIERFVKLCRHHGYKIIGFIKYKVLFSSRRLVNTEIILGTIFQSLGVPIISSNFKPKDTIAAFAYHKIGAVLSQKSVFFQYYVNSKHETTPPFKIYSGFKMRGETLSLDSHQGPKAKRIQAKPKTKKILEKLPETTGIMEFIERTDFENNTRLLFARGYGSNLTQETNPYLQARPLRQALYSRLNLGPVLERLTHWDPTTGFTNVEEVVQPDNTLEHLLKSPKKAFNEIFGASKRKSKYSEEEWRTHVFSQKSVVAEQFLWTNPSRGYLNILREI